MPVFTAPIPLALYVHIPWCARKCPYCDFNSHEAREPLPERAYVDALLADLEQDLPRVWGRRIDSLFIGGGTPSLFSAEALDRLLSGLRARLPLRPDLEITLEANPGTVERSKFAEFREVGINRLSIGVQSFDDGHLHALGRIHDRRAAIAAAEAAHAAGLDNFNLDLMFGLPGQTVAQALTDIACALALQPAHLSYYQLTLEPNTRFYRSPPLLPDDETIDVIQERAQEELARHGYPRYEVSAYARADRRCRHNLNYWEFGDYLGIGAGAHGKLSDPAAGQIQRLWKVKHPRDYLARAGTPAGVGGDAPVREAELPLEFLMNALRLVEGVPAALFGERAGLPLAA
ncbi:MAG TPA: radical SAM family heme chaperone HemW, partial [Candidatus Competibacter sp.]|nr:radical SAM family heme chaperone HemW [Candidatus Competibacter sp.]